MDEEHKNIVVEIAKLSSNLVELDLRMSEIIKKTMKNR